MIFGLGLGVYIDDGCKDKEDVAGSVGGLGSGFVAPPLVGEVGSGLRSNEKADYSQLR